MALALTKDLAAQKQCTIPVHALFPQLVTIIEHFVAKKVEVLPPSDKKDLWLSPYYGWVIERLLQAIRPDTSLGDAPEIPRYESSRGPGSTSDVDFFTKREVREVVHSHLNFMVADTEKWEQSAAYLIDTHPDVHAFVKNSGLGFAIPYLHNGQMHDYVPDFVIRLKSGLRLILETKGYDPLVEVKRAAAERWVKAVNAGGGYGCWHYRIVRRVSDVVRCVAEVQSERMGNSQGRPIESFMS